MLNINDVPTPRAHAIIPAGSRNLLFDRGNVVYNGHCPAYTEKPHFVSVDRNIAKCATCGTEITAIIVRPSWPGEPYLRLEF